MTHQIKKKKKTKFYVHTVELRLDYTSHHRTKRATFSICRSLFLFLEKLSKKKQLLLQQQQQNKQVIDIGSNNIIRWLALSLRPSFLLSALHMVFLSLSNSGGYAAASHASISASLASGGGSRSRSRILSKVKERAYCGTRGFRILSGISSSLSYWFISVSTQPLIQCFSWAGILGILENFESFREINMTLLEHKFQVLFLFFYFYFIYIYIYIYIY